MEERKLSIKVGVEEKLKILLISDSHGEFKKINKMYKKEKPEIVIFSGDGAKDFEELSYAYPESKFIGVKGNVDFDYNMNIRVDFEIEGKKILLTHGHLYGVKSSYGVLLAEAKRGNADIVVFGHTHEPLNESFDGIKLFNPGSAKDGNYGIMIFESSELKSYNKSL